MRREAIVLITLLISVSCGGSSATRPRHVDDDVAEVANEGEQSAGDPLAEGEVSTPRQQGACQGSQCASCGSAVCLEGFYCDEQAMACSWLPQCADEFGCDCITKVLPKCVCEERDGGTYVTCD